MHMTITELEKIIDQNTEAAEGGCPKAQALVVTAMAWLEAAKEREELTDFSMLTDEEMAGNW